MNRVWAEALVAVLTAAAETALTWIKGLKTKGRAT